LAGRLPVSLAAIIKAFYSAILAKVLFDFRAYFDRLLFYLNREIGIPWQMKLKAI
jgi:hypothetical protein